MVDLIRSDEYAQQMNETVLPYLDMRMQEGMFETLPDQFLHYKKYTADQAYGSIVMLHGYSEGIDKYREMVYYFLNMGYHVWQLQQREHGRSYRSTEDMNLIHIEDYRDLIKDLHRFVTKVVKPDTDIPLYFYGHSMGGGVGACYLEKFPEDFEKAVLSSPMLELNNGSIPVWAARAAAFMLVRHDHGEDYMPGSKPFDAARDFENSNCTCQERYEYWLEEQKKHVYNQMCVTSYAAALELLHITECALTKQNAQKVRAKVLLFQAGKDTLVKSSGQDAFLKLIGEHGQKHFVREAKHEIYLSTDEVLQSYVEEIDAFYRA